ncbi:GST-like protein [Sphingomonas sp. HMP6]|nr:GST-like protein [Sphingomonas sp. HMP6]
MGSIMLPITLMTAGAAAILNLWLAMRTGAVRTKAKVSIGDGGNEMLIRRMRAHANFVEYAPFIIILIGLLEFTTGTSLWLWVASALFLLARVAHPLGMDGLPAGRMIGTLLTFLLLLGLGGYAVTLPFLPHSSGGTPAVSVMPAG